jgi:hypothetical protein
MSTAEMEHDKAEWVTIEQSGTVVEQQWNRDASLHTHSTLISSSQWSRARASERRTIDSSWRTVIRYDDLPSAKSAIDVLDRE